MPTRQIYIEPAWKMHSFYHGLAAHPPEGYEFVTSEPFQERLANVASHSSLSYWLLSSADSVIPVNLVKSYLERFKRIPGNVCLTYSFDHMVFRKEPWIVDMEYVSLIVSYNVKQFRRYKRIVERLLASDYCRKIICGTLAAQKTVRQNLDCAAFEGKMEIVPFAVHGKDFTKGPTGDRIKILFVGSANIAGQFEIKGGIETLEAFNLLNQKYDNLELVLRSDIPRNLELKYDGSDNVRIIKDLIPWPLLENEFQTADIFLLPVHNTPFSVLLDAMSYELPIVTIDAWANSEVVADGQTGLVAGTSHRVPYYVEGSIPNFGTPDFMKSIRIPDPKVVQELVENTSVLIENEELRREMGKAGRWEVEHGKFSIDSRNEKLKRIFDEATA